MTNLTKKVHVSELKRGDTVLLDGEMQTVSNHHLTTSPMFGKQYKGYNFRETKGHLEVVLFPKYYRGEVMGYVTQL